MKILSQGRGSGLWDSAVCRVLRVGVPASLFLPFLFRAAAGIRKALRGESGFSFGPS
jgi:hypothetical protein